MKTWKQLTGLEKLFLTVILIFPLIFQPSADTTIIVSLAGDTDSLGTGLPLGIPLILRSAVHDPSDGPFDQRMTTPCYGPIRMLSHLGNGS